MQFLSEAYSLEPNPGARAEIAFEASLVAGAIGSSGELEQADRLLVARRGRAFPERTMLYVPGCWRGARSSAASAFVTTPTHVLACSPWRRGCAARPKTSALPFRAGVFAGHDGHFRIRTAQVARAAVADATTFTADAAAGRAMYFAIRALTVIDEFQLAADRLDLFVQDAERRRSPFVLMAGLSHRALLQHSRGRLRDAEADAEQAIALGSEQIHARVAGLAVAELARVLLDQDRPDDAAEVLERHRWRRGSRKSGRCRARLHLGRTSAATRRPRIRAGRLLSLRSPPPTGEDRMSTAAALANGRSARLPRPRRPRRGCAARRGRRSSGTPHRRTARSCGRTPRGRRDRRRARGLEQLGAAADYAERCDARWKWPAA